MANSSDWIALASEGAQRGAGSRNAPGWMAALSEPTGFRDGAPFMARPAAEAEPTAHPVQSAGDQSAGGEAPPPAPLDEARAAGYAEGLAAGRAEAQAAIAEERENQRALRLSVRALDQSAMDALASDLTRTVITLCEQVLGDYAVDTVKLLERCNEAATRLGALPQSFTLYLNPDDISALGPDPLDGWRILPDPSMARGALRLEGENGAVRDGPDDWRRAIETALGRQPAL